MIRASAASSSRRSLTQPGQSVFSGDPSGDMSVKLTRLPSDRKRQVVRQSKTGAVEGLNGYNRTLKKRNEAISAIMASGASIDTNQEQRARLNEVQGYGFTEIRLFPDRKNETN